MGFTEDVELLKGKRIIKKDKDVSERTGYKKSTISNYLSGKLPPSKPFLEKFYEVYSSDLGVNKVSTTPSNLSNLDKEILRLQSIIEEKNIVIADKNKHISALEKIVMYQESMIGKQNKKVAHMIHHKARQG